MTAAAPTSEPTNPSTAVVRLLAAARWLVILLLLHWLIIGGRKLTAALRRGTDHPDFPFFARRFGTGDPDVIRARVTSGLRRARALEAELLATGPTDPRLADLAQYRAIGAQIVDIGRDFGAFRPVPARIVRRRHNTASHLNHARRRPRTTAPKTFAQPTACPLRAGATGPPCRGGFETRPYRTDIANAGVLRSFSGCAPASFLLYAPS